MASVTNHMNGIETAAPPKHTSNGVNGVRPNGVDTSSFNDPPPEPRLKSDAYRGDSRGHPRISRPVELLRPEYDVVVIGSGYGGGVSASRMARGGQSVCVLERGSERWPGEYPVSLKDALPQLHVSGQFHPGIVPGLPVDIGDPTGLYHLIVGEGQNAFVANGLGGTSLLNANVFLRTDDKTQSMKIWPEELRGPDKLRKYYERAEYMLEPEPYPKDYPELAKLKLLEKQRDALGFGKFYRAPQTTRFVNGPNNVGVEMQASTLTGMDSTGINDGSKCSTLVNYLSDAWNWGAEIFCECEVRYIKKRGEGYNVFFAWHGAKRGAFKQNLYEDLMFVHAKKLVFLGAGTLGTTEILLRSQQEGLQISSNVGTGMSGNGDILAFGYNTNEMVNSMGREQPSPEWPIGPTITGIIDCRDQDNPLDGFVIEEGAVPAALAPLYQFMLESLPGRIYPRDTDLVQRIHHALASVGSRVFGPYSPSGSLQRTQVYLIMSHDSNQAVMTLKDDKPILTFLGVGRSEHVKYLNDVLADATNAVGGTFVNSPFFASLNQQEITVHPIGGACISSNGTGTKGVTTHTGEVLKGGGTEVHDGLVVVDGALVPTALGVNPFATITALAEQAVEKVAEKKGIKIDYETKNGLLDLYGAPAHPYAYPKDSIQKAERTIREAKRFQTPGIEFSEIMAGFIHLGHNIEEFTTAAKAARGKCENARFFLSVRSWDLDQLISANSHKAMLTGSFSHGSLPASPYMVLRGDFQLFNEDSRATDTTNLTYDFDMIGTDGSILHFHGYKVVDPSCAGSVVATWKATSTLYVTLTKPRTDQIVGRGMLNIDPLQFGSELLTFTPVGSTLLSRAVAMTRFLAYFTTQVASKFLGPLSPLQWPTRTHYHGYLHKAPPTSTFQVLAADGVQSNMQCWEPVPGVAEKPVNILLIPGAAVDHQIYALPTVKQNAVEYFTEKGYRVFCVTSRIGKTAAQGNWTGYDARKDVFAALEEVRRRQLPSDKKIYVIAHCVGSIALASGLLDGTIPATWLQGVTASQIFFNPAMTLVNTIKAHSPIPIPSIYNLAAGSWFSCSSTKDDTIVQQLLNQALRFYPVGNRREICSSVVCHRTELVFGRLWNHANLNSATHTHLGQFFGGTSMRCITHLVQSGLAGVLLTNPSSYSKWFGLGGPMPGESLVTPRNLARLRGLPILFISGADNVTWSPESTSVSYDTLRDLFGPDDYERAAFQDMGHLDGWMSDRSAKTVFPRVWEHVESVCPDGAGGGKTVWK